MPKFLTVKASVGIPSLVKKRLRQQREYQDCECESHRGNPFADEEAIETRHNILICPTLSRGNPFADEEAIGKPGCRL